MGWQWLGIKFNWAVLWPIIKGFGVLDDEVLDELLKPDIPGNKGLTYRTELILCISGIHFTKKRYLADPLHNDIIF